MRVNRVAEKKKKAVCIAVAVVAFFSLVVAPPIFAFTAATLFPGDQAIPGGSLVSFSGEEDAVVASDVEYDENLIGVAVSPAPVVYRPSRDAQGVSVVESGVVSVLVSTLNGSIARGDFITTSPIAGVGQRADDLTKTVAGAAVDSFTGGDETTTYQGREVEVGSIRVALGIGPIVAASGASGAVQEAAGDFLDVISRALEDLLNQPGGVALFFRYIVAILITLLAVFFSLQHFGRATLHGIEAIGRNPLARRYIQLTVALNVFLGVVVSVAAVILSFFIIV